MSESEFQEYICYKCDIRLMTIDAYKIHVAYCQVGNSILQQTTDVVSQNQLDHPSYYQIGDGKDLRDLWLYRFGLQVTISTMHIEALQYLYRAGMKSIGLPDLKKARNTIDRMIQMMENSEVGRNE